MMVKLFYTNFLDGENNFLTVINLVLYQNYFLSWRAGTNKNFCQSLVNRWL